MADSPTIEGLAAKADEVADKAKGALHPAQHRSLLEEMDAVYHEVLAEAARHYNRAHAAADEALHRSVH